LVKKTVLKKRSSVSESSINIPSSIFRDRSLKPLEAIAMFLKEQKSLSYHEIAVLLNRNDRTIWTVCNRAKKKK
jgi:hypothetical protein